VASLTYSLAAGDNAFDKVNEMDETRFAQTCMSIL